MAIADIQQQAGQSNDPFSCPNGQPDGFTPSFSNLTGHFQVTITSVSYWNGSGWQSGCVAGAAQQYTLTISNASAGWSTTETTVISDPGAPASPTPIGTASQLAWVQQPTTGSAYAPMSPQPEVAVEDSSGNIVTSDFSSVTLQVVSGPTGGTISSTCSGVESYGLVQFSDCSLSNAGTYQIQAVDSGSGVSSTPSATVTVTPATAAKIAFTSNSLTGSASNSATLGAITVQEQDAFGDAFPTTTPVTVDPQLELDRHEASSLGPRTGRRSSPLSPYPPAPRAPPSTTATPKRGPRPSRQPQPAWCPGPNPRPSPRRRPPSSSSRATR